MTSEKLATLKEAASKAEDKFPGPWKYMNKVTDSDPDSHVRVDQDPEDDDGDEVVTDWCVNLEFIAAASPDVILDLIQKLEEAPKWVSCSQKMPEENSDILYVVTTRGCLPYVVRGQRTYDGNDWWWCDEDGEFDEAGNDPGFSTVMHWMPVPAPPNESPEEKV